MLADSKHRAKSLRNPRDTTILRFPTERTRQPVTGQTPSATFQFLVERLSLDDVDAEIAADVRASMSRWIHLAEELMAPFFREDFIIGEIDKSTPLEDIEATLIFHNLKAVERLLNCLSHVELNRARLCQALRTSGGSHGR